MFIFNTDLLLIDVGLAKAFLVFFVSLVAMLLFAAATQGYFIAKSRRWETVVILLIVFTLFRPDFWLNVAQDEYTASKGLQILLLSLSNTGRYRSRTYDPKATI